MKVKMYKQEDHEVWQIGISGVSGVRSVSIPLDKGYLTTNKVMQFVSQVLYYDEEGKSVWQDIYEDDIVEVKYEAKGKLLTKIGRVSYSEDYGAFIIQWNYHKHQHHLFLIDSWKEIKVLGNVHQNPNIELSNGTYWE